MGKPYTMREMKQIVDHLVEHRLYGEIKGRKMWMDLENSHKLDRTWQSLKETFLKRILPDIHNPYYKLSVQEIASFRGGTDVTGKHYNKLEIHTVVEDSSNSNGDLHMRDNQQPSTSKAIPENKISGEDIQCEKSSSRNRSSTDTLVLETCGEEVEEELQEAESKSLKSLRDLITYSDPLTPMLQEVLHDFDSDEDPPMHIVEDNEINPQKPKSPSPFEIRQSKSMKNTTENSPIKPSAENKTDDGNQSPRSQPGKIKSLRLKKTRKGTWENKRSGYVSDNSPKKDKDQKRNSQTSKTMRSTKSMEHVVPDIMKTNGNVSITEKNKSSINCSNASTGTPIPNNQEALNKPEQPANKNDKISLTNGDLKRSLSPQIVPKRKRSKGNSVDTSTSSDVKIIKDTEGTVVSIIDTPSQNDSSKEDIPHSKNMQQKDESNENKNCTGDDTDNTKAINVITTSEENIEMDVQKEAGPSAKVNVGSDPSADKNPCLNSVSLFHEQFSTERYSGSESDDDAIKSKAKNVEVNLKTHDATTEHEKNKTDNANNDEAKKTTSEKGILKKNAQEQEVITISESPNEKPSDVVPIDNPACEMAAGTGSRSSADSHFEKPKQKSNIPGGRIFQKSQREKALANVFGFTSGGVRKRAKHHRIGKRNSGRRYSRAMEESSSTSQTTETDSDDSASPQNRNHHRKYLKPKPYRILSQMDGALFAVEGNRVYPIVRQDNQRMNFAELFETEEENADMYWKKKYEEEKIRANELARLLELQKRTVVSPILQAKANLNSNIEQDKQQKETKDAAKERAMRISDASETKAEQRQNNAVKIKFNRDNEIELECQFPHVDPLLEKMAKMFHLSAAGKPQEPPPPPPAEQPIEIDSGTTTPLALAPRDPEVSEKIEKKESEIFRQIEVLDKMEQNEPSPADSNVTKRKPGRPRKFSALSVSSLRESVNKEARAASVDNTPAKIRKTVGSKSPVKSDTSATTNNTKRRSARMVKEDAKADQQNKVTDASLLGKSSKTTEVDIPLDDSQVRYKFPDKPRSTSRTRVPNKRNADYMNIYSKGDPKIWSPPVTCNTNSIESSFGYQDSDASLESTVLRRRKKHPSSHFYRKYQTRIQVRRRSHPYLADDDTCETITSIRGSAQNATLNTEVYTSESYQLLGVRNQNEVTNYKNKSNVQSFAVNDDNVSATLRVDSSRSSRTEEGNSSNISLPLSPELSVVEDISITKEVLERVEGEQPILNETFGNDEVKQNSDFNKYMMSEIDVSVPLMRQDCEFQTESQMPVDEADTETGMISESLLGKICTVNLKEQSSSDTLAVKLGNLLLESAKKIAQKIQGDDDPNKENTMEVDTTVKKVKKTRVSKNRCSTPHKRVSKNKNAASLGAVLEEHLETCSYSGRKSCPPAIKIFPCDDLCHFEEQNNNTVLDAVNTNRRGKKKKDIIKVKITRPKKDKNSLSKKDLSDKETLHGSRKSVCTDSGINDESYLLQCCDEDSIELIHNHSETCLHINECLGDSVEFIQNGNKTIISVDSDSLTCENDENNAEDKELPELFCNNAQDAVHLNVRHGLNGGSNESTVYFTPLSPDSPNSLMTEDLSDEIAPEPETRQVRPGKWYICSDEETTTFPEEESPAAGVGANLKQLFTLVCAVPNLSTISETSRENDSRKPTLETDNEK